MTSDDSEFAILSAKGVICKTDVGLYSNYYSNNIVYFLSIYGAPQQVKAIFASLATGQRLEVTSGNESFSLSRDYQSSLRFKGFSVGYGKAHGIIWQENIGQKCVIWTSPEERDIAFLNAISKRKIPFDKSWLQKMEVALKQKGFLTPLLGWGGIGGYVAKWADDAICELIVTSINRKVKRKVVA